MTINKTNILIKQTFYFLSNQYKFNKVKTDKKVKIIIQCTNILVFTCTLYINQLFKHTIILLYYYGDRNINHMITNVSILKLTQYKVYSNLALPVI